MSNRVIKFRAWDGKRMTTSGIMFNSSTGNIESAANMPVMQSTGMHDINGVEIYEGDIVDIDGGKIYGKFLAKVDFYNGIFGYMNMTCKSITPPEDWKHDHPITDSGWFFGGFSQLGGGGYAKHDDVSYVEVIGNVYETP